MRSFGVHLCLFPPPRVPREPSPALWLTLPSRPLNSLLSHHVLPSSAAVCASSHVSISAPVSRPLANFLETKCGACPPLSTLSRITSRSRTAFKRRKRRCVTPKLRRTKDGVGKLHPKLGDERKDVPHRGARRTSVFGSPRPTSVSSPSMPSFAISSVVATHYPTVPSRQRSAWVRLREQLHHNV